MRLPGPSASVPAMNDASPEGHEPSPPAPDDAPRGRRRISRRNRQVLRDLHHRTWELELLVSGAVLFLLAQVPAPLDRTFHRLDPLLGETSGLLLFMGYYYLKLVVYTLVVGFGVHLVTRAFWVALVGLDSVFPRGVRWDRLRIGPWTRRVYRSVLPSVRELIVGADAIASVIFAAAFMVVGIFVVSVVTFLTMSAVIGGIVWLTPIEVDGDRLLLVTAVLVVALALGFQVLDRVVGPRVSPTGILARLIRRMAALQARIFGLEIYGPVQFTLFSHIGSRRAGVALGVFVAGLVGYFFVNDLILGRGEVEYAALGILPARAGALGVDPVHYDEYRPGLTVPDPFVPTIPRETLGADDVWVRVFVPARPSVDTEAMAATCPGVEGVPGGLRRVREGSPPDSALPRLQAGLRCLAALWVVTVDGAPVAGSPVFYRHPDSGSQGVAWFIDARDLAPGVHRIRVARAPGPTWPEDSRRGPPSYEILFWR